MIKVINNFEPVRRSESSSSNWRVDIVLSPEEKVVEIYPFFGNGQPMRAWNGVDIVLASFPWGNWADISDLISFLEEEGTQEDLESIVEGHTVRWDGSNHRGSLTEEASYLADHLRDKITSRVDFCPCFWKAYEFFGFAGYRFWMEEGENIVSAGSIAAWAEEEVQRRFPEYFLDADDLASFASEQIQECFHKLDSSERALALRLLNRTEGID